MSLLSTGVSESVPAQTGEAVDVLGRTPGAVRADAIFGIAVDLR